MNKIEILQKIYNSEINFALVTSWDGGFTVIVGPEPYGEILTKGRCEYRSLMCNTLEEAMDHLIEKIVEMYPNSKFTREYLSS